jgi:hypothetical protein
MYILHHGSCCNQFCRIADIVVRRNRGSTVTKIEKIRQAFGDYVRSEGCSCCQDVEGHEKAASTLAKLLGVDKYEDDSGFDFYKYATPEE